MKTTINVMIKTLTLASITMRAQYFISQQIYHIRKSFPKELVFKYTSKQILFIHCFLPIAILRGASQQPNKPGIIIFTYKKRNL